MKDFSVILKELRNKKNISQEELGIIVHVSRSSIAKYENGLGLPSEEVIASLCSYFNVDKDYLFPKDNIEKVIVEKNKKIKMQMIIIIIIIVFSILIASFFIVANIISKSARSGKLEVINAEKISLTPSNRVQSFTLKGYEFSYVNVYRNDKKEFVLCKGGELYSTNGIPDYFMGYYDGNNTSLYVYRNGLEKIKVDYNFVSSNGKYCYNVSEYKVNHNFVIVNNTSFDVNIGNLEFWC